MVNIPNFNAMKPLPKLGPPPNMAQGYGNAVPDAVNSYQQLQRLQALNPNARYSAAFNRRNAAGQQYRQLERASTPAIEFAGYLSRNNGGNAQQILGQFANQGLGQYANRTQEFGDWMARETQRSNASGMLSRGFGAMIPGLAMMAFPAAGLANVATGAAMGGITGGPVGAALGGLSSAVAPRVNVPSGALRAPVQAAKSVARQFASPVTAGRQALASALGSWRRSNA